MTLGLVVAGLFYLAVLCGVLGVIWRIVQYARTPQRHRIALTPAPRSRLGVWARMARETLAFASLLRADPLLWCLAWPFHLALLVLLLHHGQYFGFPTLTVWTAPLADIAAWLLPATGAGLLLRRLIAPRVRYISAPSDYLWPGLFLLIAGTGLTMRYVALPDLGMLYRFLRGWANFDVQPIPADPVLLCHLLGAALVLALLPFSKLLHAPAVFFAPTLNQRER